MQIELGRQNRLNGLLRSSLEHFITHQDLAATSAFLLDGLLVLTDSASGFLGEVLHGPDGTPYLKTHAITNIAWDEASRSLYDESQAMGMEFRNLNTLFGAVLSTGKAVIANNPATDPRRSNASPQGHPPLNAFLGIPVYHHETLIGMAGLANRPSGYDENILALLDTLTLTYASLLAAARLRRAEQQRLNGLEQARVAAELSSRAQADFLANWGYDVRTQLNALLGHTRLLQMDTALDAKNQPHIKEIAESGQVLARLVGTLLDRIGARPVQATECHEPEMAVKPGPQQDFRILVVEDHPANQMLLRMQLTALGFAADICSDGAAAMVKWQTGGYDLILADRHLPVIDGLELARSIRHIERDIGKHIPIIAITALQYADGLALCHEAGMDDVLPKPIALEALRVMLERWLPRIQTDLATLDIAYLLNVIGETDTKQTLGFVDLFISTARDQLPACHSHLAKADSHALALVMHKLKSSARIVGALGFADLAARLETTANAGQLDEAQMYLSALENNLQAVAVAARHLKAQPIEAPASPLPAASITSDTLLAGIRLGEFEVYFQPKLAAKTLCVVGVEALARWQQDGKPVSPSIFIATAEQQGVIGPLSEILLTKALIGGVRLAEAGYPLPVTINLHAAWLSNAHFPQFLQASILAFGFKAENLFLEITEADISRDMATVLSVMTRLRLKGFKLSIKDFGTGFLASVQLPRLPVNELKLDRSFVRAAAETATAKAQMAAILAIAKTLNLATVAEGIESQADLDLVRGLGCEAVQGWFTAEEMPEERLLPWLKGWG